MSGNRSTCRGANHVEHFINHNWRAINALAYGGFIEHGPGALGEVASGEPNGDFFFKVSYAPAACFLPGGDLASKQVFDILDAYDPGRDAIVLVIDPEEDFRCLCVERALSPPESFVLYDGAEDDA